jgi:hypothetical protein
VIELIIICIIIAVIGHFWGMIGVGLGILFFLGFGLFINLSDSYLRKKEEDKKKIAEETERMREWYKLKKIIEDNRRKYRR